MAGPAEVGATSAAGTTPKARLSDASVLSMLQRTASRSPVPGNGTCCCPSCGQLVLARAVNTHLDRCLLAAAPPSQPSNRHMLAPMADTRVAAPNWVPLTPLPPPAQTHITAILRPPADAASGLPHMRVQNGGTEGATDGYGSVEHPVKGIRAGDGAASRLVAGSSIAGGQTLHSCNGAVVDVVDGRETHAAEQAAGCDVPASTAPSQVRDTASTVKVILCLTCGENDHYSRDCPQVRLTPSPTV